MLFRSLVAALPLLHVAWSDGSVQASEAKLVLQIAHQLQLLGEGDEEIVKKWLVDEPSPFFFHRGRKILGELFLQDPSEPMAVDAELLRDVVACCEGVADSAGGVFGLFGRIANEEREAIEKIAGALRVEQALSWSAIRHRFVD